MLAKRFKESFSSLVSGHKRLADPICASRNAALLLRLSMEKFLSRCCNRKRIMAIACWSFPIYSQNFVYQELVQLINKGYALRLLYFHEDDQCVLPDQFTAIWQGRRRLLSTTGWHDYQYLRNRYPQKMAALIVLLAAETGKTAEELLGFANLLHAFTFTRAVERYAPHYLHSYFFYEGALLVFVASYLLGIPRGVSCYADHLLDDYPIKIVRLHLQQARIIIATSKRIKTELTGLAPGVDSTKILVKPNAINCAAFPVVALDTSPGRRCYRLVSVCRIEPKKGLIYLIEAMALLVQQEYSVSLHIIGGVDNCPVAEQYAAKLGRLVEHLQLSSVVNLEGRKSENEIKDFFCRTDIFVAPFIETDQGDKDGIPTSILEAMASGLPIIATDAGSISEILDEESGVLVGQRDPQALTTAIISLLADSEKRLRLGRKAGEKVRAEFDVTACEHIFHHRLAKIAC